MNYVCANDKCKMQLLDLHNTNIVDTGLPQVDDVLICGACGHASVITLTGTEPLAEAAFDAMTDEEKRDILFARRAAKRNLRN